MAINLQIDLGLG